MYLLNDIDEWWHQVGIIMKHISESTNDSDLPHIKTKLLPENGPSTIGNNPQSNPKVAKKNFHD